VELGGEADSKRTFSMMVLVVLMLLVVLAVVLLLVAMMTFTFDAVVAQTASFCSHVLAAGRLDVAASTLT